MALGKLTHALKCNDVVYSCRQNVLANCLLQFVLYRFSDDLLDHHEFKVIWRNQTSSELPKMIHREYDRKPKKPLTALEKGFPPNINSKILLEPSMFIDVSMTFPFSP